MELLVTRRDTEGSQRNTEVLLSGTLCLLRGTLCKFIVKYPQTGIYPLP
jgi:hypothetical protein